MSTRRERAKAQNAQQSRSMAVAVSTTKKEHPIAKKLGDFFIDVAKLLAGLMKQDIDYLVLSIIGGITVVLFLSFGMWLINYANKEVI